ncbi:hypothetical protein J4230_04540 [Candidatus Woesearchaeota archaeon]|nr:hypothetical protein [Candidatus Woesearchaeota archaeon]
MVNIKELNEYIKTLKRDVIVLQYLLYEKCCQELKEFDELEYYEKFIKSHEN